MSKTKARKILTYTLFVLPAVLFFSLVILVPFVRAIIFSFQDWNGISSEIKWAGLDNFRHILSDTGYYKSFVFTLKFVAISTLLLNVVGFFLAVILNMALKSRNILRTIFFMPHVIGPLLIGFIWQFIFTEMFAELGIWTGWSLFMKSWLSLPAYSFYALVIVTVWHTAGYLMIIYLAALQGVPHDLLEAAEIDGANHWQKLRSIILPLVRPAVTICLFLAISSGFKVFDLNFALTKGGPFGTTESIALHIYFDAFEKNNYTLASAKSVVFFWVLASVTLIQVFVMKRKEVEM